jgi:CubicO group peptidase (beta-lactamase class C family)
MTAEFVRRHIAFPRLSCLPGLAGWMAHEQDGREAGTVNEQDLRSAVTQAAAELAVPGVAVGVYHQGTEHYAFHGVTSAENPLPVDTGTLFQFGSTGKTYTATAIMRLVDRGEVDLDAPVRRYVPELVLKDEATAERVTVLQLLNHTAGWSGDLLDNTGTGDDALAKYVARMARLEQVTPLGTTVSYNNASLSLAGRLIELVTGKTFEHAMKELVLKPLGLAHSFFFPNDVMTRRFVVGHNQQPDGTITVARPWALPRGSNPAGGITSDAGDLIRWARFHLGDGRAADGTRVLPAELLRSMQQPTAQSPGNAVGDAVGISWWLRDAGGVRVVAHGGNTLGQDSSFDMVPERDFAVITLANCSPNGSQLNERIRRWAFETYIGVTERDPEPVSMSTAELLAYAGHYETIASTAEITAADGSLMVAIEIRPEVRAELTADSETDPDLPPFSIGLLEGAGDRYIVSDGPAKGMKGYFARSETGEVTGIHLGGRLATRTGPPAGARTGAAAS